MITSFAQNLEDVVLFRALKDTAEGFYIDVGANDPILHSVTRLFYERGWRGVNIEPSPYWYQRVVTDRPRDINLNVAVSNAAGFCTFHEIEGSGLSTIFQDIATRHDSIGFASKAYEVATETLSSICERHAPETIHFLKVDAEGAEELVLKGADFRRHRPWIVLVEATEPLSATPSHFGWEPLLTQSDYEFALFDGLNRFYVAREKEGLKAYLSVKGDEYQTIEAVRSQENWRKTAEAMTAERDQMGAALDQLRQELETVRHELAVVTNSRWWRGRERLLELVARGNTTD